VLRHPRGFLAAEACTTGGAAILLDEALAQPTLQPITGKAEAQ
jgi:hypothetical protein